VTTFTVIDQAQAYVSTGGAQSPKHQAVTSNGVYWKALWTNSNIAFFSSTNDGDTWTWQGAITQIFDGMITHGGAFSFVIDADDYIHLIYEHYGGGGDGRTTAARIEYRRGTLNAAKDTIASWSSAWLATTSYDYWHNVDLVAVKIPGTARTWVHLVWSYNWAGDNRQILVYQRLFWEANLCYDDTGVQFLHDVAGGGIVHCRPSIEFRHDGSGKVPQQQFGDYQPDIYISYSIQYQLRFAKIPYNASLGEYEAHSTQTITTEGSNFGGTTGALNYYIYETHRWTKTLYDARTSSVIVVGQLINQALTTQAAYLFEQFADDTFWSFWGGYTSKYTGDAVLDASGNLWLSAIDRDDWAPPNSPFKLWKIDRSDFDFRPIELVEVLDIGTDEARANMMPYPKISMHIIWTDFVANAQPYNIRLARRTMSNTKYYTGTAWVDVIKSVYTNGQWVPYVSKVY
jgi:hypothetical protein